MRHPYCIWPSLRLLGCLRNICILGTFGNRFQVRKQKIQCEKNFFESFDILLVIYQRILEHTEPLQSILKVRSKQTLRTLTRNHTLHVYIHEQRVDQPNQTHERKKFTIFFNKIKKPVSKPISKKPISSFFT